jgi:hypothetical protein
MASEVKSGTGNFTYTNSTGQNVRVVINFMRNPTSMNWAGTSVSSTNVIAIGRNLAFSTRFSDNSTISANNMCISETSTSSNASFPTEIMLSATQTFTATCGAYNIVVIPEAG